MVQLELNPDDATRADERADGARRALTLALASVLTVAAFSLAFVLGAAYFESRRHSAHEQRLARMLLQSPLIDQVEQGLRDDGSPLMAAPRDQAELRALVERLGGPRRDDILAKGRRWPLARVFRASDMLYFIFFDAAGTMRDYACVSA